MIEPILLSDNNADEAQTLFTHWLNNEPVTLLVILGESSQANGAVDAATSKINENPNYNSVRVIHAPTPDLLTPVLSNLAVREGEGPINWANLSEYVLFSISAYHNNIGKVLNTNQYSSGRINQAILYAQASDEAL